MNETMTVSEAAHEAWARRAERQASQMVETLRRKVSPLVKLTRDEYEVDANMFDDEVLPVLRVGADVDGIRFCLLEGGVLAVVSWSCEAKDCDDRKRAPVSDMVSVGRALALGAKRQAEMPKCAAHIR